MDMGWDGMGWAWAGMAWAGMGMDMGWGIGIDDVWLLRNLCLRSNILVIIKIFLKILDIITY